MRAHKLRMHWPPMVLVATLITNAKAQPKVVAGELASAPDADVYLSVERMAGSESCPDAEAVFRSLTLLFPERSMRRGHDQSAATRVDISIRPMAAGHEAQLKIQRPRRGERVIAEPDADCRGLSEALAVALVMLTDSQTEQLSEAPDATTSTTTGAPLRTSNSSPTPATRAPAVATPNRPKPAERGTIVVPRMPAAAAKGVWSSYARISTIGTYRVLSEPELGMVIGADVFHATGFGVQLAALGMWARPTESLGGSIQHRRFGAVAATCYSQAVWGRSEYQLCIESGAGALYTRTESYDVIYEPRRRDWWMTVGPKLGYLYELSPWLGGYVSVAGTANLTRDRFLLEGSGLLSQSEPFGISVQIGIRLGNRRVPGGGWRFSNRQ